MINKEKKKKIEVILLYNIYIIYIFYDIRVYIWKKKKCMYLYINYNNN